MEKLDEIRKEIIEYPYRAIEDISCKYNYLNDIIKEYKKGNRNYKFEDVVNEFYSFVEFAVNNMETILEDHSNVIGKAIELENLAREIQGRVLDGGKLVSSIEQIHENVSKYYRNHWIDIPGELEIIIMGIANVYNKFYGDPYHKIEINKINVKITEDKVGTRNLIKLIRDNLTELRNVYRNATTLLINRDDKSCDKAIVDKLSILSNRIYKVYREFTNVENPTVLIEREAERIRGLRENF